MTKTTLIYVLLTAVLLAAGYVWTYGLASLP